MSNTEARECKQATLEELYARYFGVAGNNSNGGKPADQYAFDLFTVYRPVEVTYAAGSVK